MKDKRYTYAVVINDIDNDGELAGIGTVVDHNDTADFNDTLESRSALLESSSRRGKKNDSFVRNAEP